MGKQSSRRAGGGGGGGTSCHVRTQFCISIRGFADVAVSFGDPTRGVAAGAKRLAVQSRFERRFRRFRRRARKRVVARFAKPRACLAFRVNARGANGRKSGTAKNQKPLGFSVVAVG